MLIGQSPPLRAVQGEKAEPNEIARHFLLYSRPVHNLPSECILALVEMSLLTTATALKSAVARNPQGNVANKLRGRSQPSIIINGPKPLIQAFTRAYATRFPGQPSEESLSKITDAAVKVRTFKAHLCHPHALFMRSSLAIPSDSDPRFSFSCSQLPSWLSNVLFAEGTRVPFLSGFPPCTTLTWLNY